MAALAVPRETRADATGGGLVRLALDDPAWAALVAGSPAAPPFHHPAWAQVLADAYGYRAFVLAEAGGDDGGPVAGAPFLEVRSLAGRRRWISLPFTDSCPPLAPDPDAFAA